MEGGDETCVAVNPNMLWGLWAKPNMLMPSHAVDFLLDMLSCVSSSMNLILCETVCFEHGALFMNGLVAFVRPSSW